MNSDYCLERRLLELDPCLHRRYNDCVATSNSMLTAYENNFPTFTDHSVLHTMNVVNFCNQLVGNQINRLTADDSYVLLMGCLFHDVGMGVSQKDYDCFKVRLEQACQTQAIDKNIRDFHHELSALYLEKYCELLNIPNEAYLFAIKQLCRGHRKTDLKNAQAYPTIYPVGDGRGVHLSYLAPLLCLADELDIAADRNISFLFDNMDHTKFSHGDVMAFGTHQSIRLLEVDTQTITLHIQCDDVAIQNELVLLYEKLKEKLRYCREVAASRSEFVITQQNVRLLMSSGKETQ